MRKMRMRTSLIDAFVVSVFLTGAIMLALPRIAFADTVMVDVTGSSAEMSMISNNADTMFPADQFVPGDQEYVVPPVADNPSSPPSADITPTPPGDDSSATPPPGDESTPTPGVQTTTEESTPTTTDTPASNKVTRKTLAYTGGERTLFVLMGLAGALAGAGLLVRQSMIKR